MINTIPILRRVFASIFSRWRSLLSVTLCLGSSACTSVFFLPEKEHYLTPDRLGLAYEDIHLQTEDKLRLHGWLLKSNGQYKGKHKGTVYFLHGNAQNISTHVASVMWLPEQGYQVFLLDYRGYGKSSGSPDVEGALDDIATGYAWLIDRKETVSQPLFILGQSLGASLATYFCAKQPTLSNHTNGVIIDASFSSFRSIAREKLASFWLTWLFQQPLSWLIPTRYDPVDVIPEISPVPVLIIYSQNDKIIPSIHGETLFQHAAAPKHRLITSTPHIATFNVLSNRTSLLEFMDKHR